MATAAASRRHVVAVPFPGRGHINPMLVVCRQLAAADAGLDVTVVVTEEWHALLSAAGVPDGVRLATIPNVIPSEHGRGADWVGFIEAVHAKMGEAVERLLDRLMRERRPDAVVVDTHLTWGVAAGAARGIPVCSLWTMPPTFFLALYHMDRWPRVDGPEGVEADLLMASSNCFSVGTFRMFGLSVWRSWGLKSRCQFVTLAGGIHMFECQGWIFLHLKNGQSRKSLDQYFPFPVLLSVKCSDIRVPRSRELPVKRVAQAFSNLRKAQCVLFTSFYELESGAINGISQVLPCPIYTVCPSIPHISPEGNSDNIRREKYSDWLDAQPKNSVLYVSFGSSISMPSSQLEEFVMGLHDSAIRFFWVARDKAVTTTLQRISGDKGLVVPWRDQLKVLSHPSVGGFLSHCGWNSTLEAVFAGVPVLASPVAWDQLVNARLIADEWMIGIDLRDKRREDGIVSRATVSAAVTKLMDLADGDSLEMRRRTEELREASRSAIQGGGSSWSSLSSFARDLAEGKLNVTQPSQ